MLRKFQKYFSDNVNKIMLKYDGPRELNKYTILVDGSERKHFFRSDTDCLYEKYIEFLSSGRENEDIDALYKFFKELEKKIKLLYGEKAVIMFHIQEFEDLVFTLSISNEEEAKMIVGDWKELNDFICLL